MDHIFCVILGSGGSGVTCVTIASPVNAGAAKQAVDTALRASAACSACRKGIWNDGRPAAADACSQMMEEDFWSVEEGEALVHKQQQAAARPPQMTLVRVRTSKPKV